VDGHAGPPSLLASEVFAAKIVTTSLQRMLVDCESPADAVAWAQAEIEALAAAQ
jgi:multiple sugar transport system substrate-binding protein